MKQVIEAIFSQGVLKPSEPLTLHEDERVRITVESVENGAPANQAAIDRMIAGFDKMHLDTRGKLPTREELHERR